MRTTHIALLLSRINNILQKHFMLSFIFLLVSTATFGKDKKALPYVSLTLKDQMVVEGYLRSSLTDRDTLVKISPEMKGKSSKYPLSQIEKLTIRSEMNDSTEMIWIPMCVNNSISGRKGHITDTPTMLLLTYKGKKVNGYMGMKWVLVSPLTGLWEVIPHFYYQLPDTNYGNCFYMARRVIRAQRRKSLIKEFSDFPALVEMLENETIKITDTEEDPMIILKELDKILETE